MGFLNIKQKVFCLNNFFYRTGTPPKILAEFRFPDSLDGDSGRVFHFEFCNQFSSSRESNPQRRTPLAQSFLGHGSLQLVQTSG